MENKHTNSRAEATKLMDDAHSIYMAGSSVDVYAYDCTISYPDAATGRDEKVIHIVKAIETVDDARESAAQGMGLFADTYQARKMLEKAGLVCITTSAIQ